MKRENEFAVGIVVIAALALIVGGALWLSGAHLGKTEATYTDEDTNEIFFRTRSQMIAY